MTPTLPLVTAAYAAVLGLLAALLTAQVIVYRVKLRVNTGDGGHAVLAQAIRAHGNLTEQVPLALLLIAGAEIGGTPALLIHALGVALVLARLASAWGLSRSLGTSAGRQAGAGLTLVVTVAASLMILLRLASGR